jgi:proline iminopeptidase
MTNHGAPAIGMRRVTLNGTAYAYEIQGQGPLCIVLPGGPGMHPHYVGTLGGLDEFLTLLTLHPRGAGESGAAADDDYTLAAYARDVAALLDHLGRERAIVLGHSHGGMIAQRFAIDFPDRVEKLILADTAANLTEFLGDLDAALARFRDRPLFADAHDAIRREWAGEYRTAEEMGELWLREMPLYFYEWGPHYEHLRQSRIGLPVQLEPLRRFNAGEAETMDLRPDLHRITAPTLVVAGRYDFITNPQMAADIARHIPNAHLLIFERSGHMPYVEEPDAWRAAIRNFVFQARDQQREEVC